MFYAYRIQSVRFPEHGYAGFTKDLRNRLRQHHAGQNPSAAPYRPWRVVLYAAFETEETARAFEQYLKTGSGKAFAGKRLWPPAYAKPKSSAGPAARRRR